MWRRLDAAVPLLVKVIVPTVAIAVLVAAVIAVFLVHDTRRNVAESYDAQIKVIHHVVGEQYREGSDDPSVMNAFLEGLNRSAPLVVRIRVYRPIGKHRLVWADSGPEEPLSPQVPRTEAGAPPPEHLYPVGTPGDPAWVAVTVDRQSMVRAVSRAQREVLLLLALGAVVAVVAVGGVVYGFVLRRVNRLSRAARRVADGDLSVRLPESEAPAGRDALHDVARQFDRMLRVVDSRSRQQAEVVEFGQRALFGAGVPDLLEEAVERVTRGLDVDVATVLELVDDDHFVIQAARGGPKSGVGASVPLDSQAGFTLHSEGPVVLQDLRSEHRFTPPPILVELGVRSGVSVKIPGPGGPFGVLAAHTTRVRRFTPEDANFLQAMANSLGAAVRHRRAQQELAEAEERYRTLVEQVPAVVYVDAADDVSTARYVSPAYERLFGYTPEERMARPELWVELLHPEDRERVLGLSRETNRTGEPFRCEYRMVARDGRVVWVRDEAVLLRDEAGRVLGWQGILMDITERKWAEEALRRVMLQNKLILDSAGEGIFGLDREGRITFINPAAAHMLGWTVEQLVGQAGHPMIHHSRPDGSAYPPDDCPIYAALRDGSTRRLDDEVFWRHDGSSFPVEYTATPLREDGRLTGAVVSFADITERKLAEETLREAYERERQAVERLRQIDEMKNAFLSAVSHELRTPLSAVLGYALTLKQSEVQLPDEERRELLERLAANAQKLERLLADLLDVDRLERGIIEPRRHLVDVEALVREIAEEVELAGREIEIIADPLVAEIDGPKVERIVENLLVNAAKHTPPGTPVHLEVRAAEDGVLIVVEDRGAGVPDELKETVFQPFERGPGGMAHAPGTGIGLSLVARFAELHGGRAWVEDRPEGGASFRVLLPAVISGDVGGNGQVDPHGDHAPAPPGRAAAPST